MILLRRIQVKIFIGLTFIFILISGFTIFLYKNLELREKIPIFSEAFFKYDEYLLKRKIAKQPYSGFWHYELAYLYFRKGDIDKFENELRKALEVDPYSIASIYSLALHYESKWQFENALQLYKHGAKLDKEYKLPFHYGVGGMYCNLGRPMEALEAYKEALKHIDTYDIAEGKENMKHHMEEQIKGIEEGKFCTVKLSLLKMW